LYPANRSKDLSLPKNEAPIAIHDQPNSLRGVSVRVPELANNNFEVQLGRNSLESTRNVPLEVKFEANNF